MRFWFGDHFTSPTNAFRVSYENTKNLFFFSDEANVKPFITSAQTHPLSLTWELKAKMCVAANDPGHVCVCVMAAPVVICTIGSRLNYDSMMCLLFVVFFIGTNTHFIPLGGGNTCDTIHWLMNLFVLFRWQRTIRTSWKYTNDVFYFICRRSASRYIFLQITHAPAFTHSSTSYGW